MSPIVDGKPAMEINMPTEIQAGDVFMWTWVPGPWYRRLWWKLRGKEFPKFDIPPGWTVVDQGPSHVAFTRKGEP